MIMVDKNKYCVICGDEKMVDTVCCEGDVVGEVL